MWKENLPFPAKWCIIGSKYIILFKSFEHFHLLTMLGRTDRQTHTAISQAGHDQLVKMLVTLEPHGIFRSNVDYKFI